MECRVVDLFAGGGGLSLGFKKAGFDIVCAIENWKPAAEVYRSNFPEHPILEMDLAETENAVSTIEKYKPNIIIGGPPCQDFSSAGKRDETQGRADLTISFSKIIHQCLPQYFVMENVARAASSKAFKQALNIFKEAGYGVTIETLDAAFCGVPQMRKRLFVIGALHNKDNFLQSDLLEGLSKTPLTLRQYFGDKLGINHYYRHPRSYARRAVFSIDEPSPTIRGVNRPVPKGYPGHSGDTSPISEETRCLTTQERALIQTFPVDFQFPGCKTDTEQVIGNAVPVNLSMYVANRLKNFINRPYSHDKLSANLSLFELSREYNASQENRQKLTAKDYKTEAHHLISPA